ncbi:hypothetical protein C9J21_18335 [Photobacterium phosphoreum]|nr:hypothetical protein C9J21_18335 [Photobacterium phosphoreum]
MKMECILFRAKEKESNQWIIGFYLEHALTATGEIVDYAIQTKGNYPTAIKRETLGQYRPDIKAFDGDWIIAKTNKIPSLTVRGVLLFNDMECIIEQNDDYFPMCSFTAIDRSSINVTGQNIYDSPELLDYRDVHLDYPQLTIEPLELISCKAIRKSLNLTQSELSTTIGTATGTIKKWEQGKRNPTGSAAKLLRVLKKFPSLFHIIRQS